MSILGVIVEYNPFHNGHLYHLNEAKKQTNAETTIAILSGSFVQRGEPSIIDKWSKTKLALSNGVDLVIELPTIYSIQSADWFAFGSVRLLNSIGATDLVFGSESNSLQKLNLIADVLTEEPVTFKEYLKESLLLGNSYPKALSLSLERYLKEYKEIKLESNDILGLQYLVQLKKLKSKIKPSTIQRSGSNYLDKNLNNLFASATAIRNELLSNFNIDNISKFMPISTYEELINALQANRINSWDNFYSSLQIIGLNTRQKELKHIHGMSEGIENRLKEKLINSKHFYEFIEQLTTKRYTNAKIQRLLVSLLLGLSKEKLLSIEPEKGPQYIRVLGFNEQGRSYLRKIKHRIDLPLITKIPKNKHPMLEFDLQASMIYEFGLHKANYHLIEHKQIPIYIPN